MSIRTPQTRHLLLLPVAAVLALAALAPTHANAETKAWHNDFVIWSVAKHDGASCRVTLENGIACAQNDSPNPDRFTNVNLKGEGKPYFKTKQKFPLGQGEDARQLYPANRPHWSNNGVHCRLNEKAGVRCVNGEWGFRLNPHSYKAFMVEGIE